MAQSSHDFYNDKIPPFILKHGGLQKPTFVRGRITCSLRRAQMLVRHGYPVEAVHRVMQFKQAKPWALVTRAIEAIRTAQNEACGDKCGCEACKLEAMCKAIFTHSSGKQLVKTSEYTNNHVVAPTKEAEEEALLKADNYNARGDELIVSADGNRWMQRTQSGKKDKTPHAFGFMVREHAFCNLMDHFYNVLVPRWPGLKFMYTDTDALLLYIEYESNIYADLRELSKEHNVFDFSSFPKDFLADGEPMFDNNNRKKLGFLNVDPTPIKSADVERSKVWQIEYADGQRRIKHSGVKAADLPNLKRSTRPDPKMNFVDGQYVFHGSA